MILLTATPEIWSWGDTWAVTGIGFGIVLVLLFSLVFIMMGLGKVMQMITAPKAPQAPKAEQPKTETAKEEKKRTVVSSEPTDEGTKAAIAMALAQADNNDLAAVAYALYLSRHSNHDIPTAMISLKQRETAWNTKSVGMNNVGF